MARQAGGIKITGSIENFCFYKMQGAYYVRMKSSLTGKRFRRDAAFEGSRKSCSRFAVGNQLASQVYRKVSKDKRHYRLFCQLRTEAIFYLKQGRDPVEVIKLLKQHVPAVAVKKPKGLPELRKTAFPAAGQAGPGQRIPAYIRRIGRRRRNRKFAPV